MQTPSSPDTQDKIVPFSGSAFLTKHLLIEATTNGTDGAHIATQHSGNVLGHDALWYTFYERDKFNRATEAARCAMSPLAKTLIVLGCDPDRKNAFDLSYNDLIVN